MLLGNKSEECNFSSYKKIYHRLILKTGILCLGKIINGAPTLIQHPSTNKLFIHYNFDLFTQGQRVQDFQVKSHHISIKEVNTNSVKHLKVCCRLQLCEDDREQDTRQCCLLCVFPQFKKECEDYKDADSASVQGRVGVFA